jgi:MraZ protein
MLLTGTFARILDDKLRVAIPKQFRPPLGGSAESPIYLAPGTDRSLAIYSEKAFQTLADRLGQASPAGKDVRDFGRLYFAQVRTVELDGQGRVRIPNELAVWAQLSKDVVLVGVSDHLELWDKQLWEAYVSEKQSHFDELAESAFKV